MIVIEGRSGKSIRLANYINHNIGKDKKVIMFDSVNVPSLQWQIEKDYDHYMIAHAFENLLADLHDENAQELIKDVDVIVFECNIREEQLKALDKYNFNQKIIVTVQTDGDCKVYDTDNIGG